MKLPQIVLAIALTVTTTKQPALADFGDSLTQPVGGWNAPLYGAIIKEQRSGTDSTNSNNGGYIPPQPLAPFIQPSPPPVVAPVFTAPIVCPNSGYNNFGNNNYSSPYSNYGYYNSNGYDNSAAVALIGATAIISVVATVKLSRFFIHKMASNRNGHEHYRPHQINVSKPYPSSPIDEKSETPAPNVVNVSTSDNSAITEQLEAIKAQLGQKYSKLGSDIN